MSAAKVHVALISLGCAKNLVDSENMLALLKDHGYAMVEDAREAEAVIINTCGFIESAKRESIDAIIEATNLKRDRCRALVVTGCLVQRYEEELRAEIPEVDIWLNTLNFTEIAERLQAILPTESLPDASHRRRVLTTPSHWAYIKIAEGCDNCCTFCAIPSIRGPYSSRSIEDIVAETRELIDAGVKEIVLLAQDTTAYGIDLYGKPMLVELLQALVKEDVTWIRLLYSYGCRIDDDLLALMEREEKICPYLDIPMQHAADTVLKRMGRPERHDTLLELVKKIRSLKRDFAIRSTFIVGFPGETEADFETLCHFLEAAHLDWVGVFPYSQEEGTKAAAMPDQVPEDIRYERYHRLMALLSRLSLENMERWHGENIPVMIEGETAKDAEYCKDYPYYGRSPLQGPDNDGLTFVRSDVPLSGGDLVTVKITATDVYDLMGEKL